MNRRGWQSAAALGAAAGLAAWLAWGNRSVALHRIAVACPRLPEAFTGFRIALVSDLHDTAFGRGNRRLLARLAEARPDLIAVTGDILHSRRPDGAVAAAFAEAAAGLAPTYFVTGNHEARVRDVYRRLEARMEAAGVQVLRGGSSFLVRGGDFLQIIGLDDPCFYRTAPAASALARDLARLRAPDTFTVLLVHRPELLELYAAAGVDLVLCGHAHGGQVRLPGIGGLLAPGQGLFPAYDGGLYRAGDTQMVVSRGLGNSVCLPRIGNRPEVVLVELMRQENG